MGKFVKLSFYKAAKKYNAIANLELYYQKFIQMR